MNFGDIKMFASGAVWLTKLPVNLLKRSIGKDIPIKNDISWDEEKQDILERANWLCDMVIQEPAQVLKEMPAFLGPNYGGQWAIYSCSMLTMALANISRIYPEEKQQSLERMAKLIEIVTSKELQYYDAMQYKEYPLETLDGPKSHMSYISILAWMITNYKFTGGDGRFDDYLHACCEALNRRMLTSKDLNLPTFPNGIIFFPDMLVPIVALKNYAKLYNGKYADIANQWLQKARTEWLHKGTGLLIGYIHPRRQSRPVRGSYTGLSCYYLTLVDEILARDQYEKMKLKMVKNAKIGTVTLHGIKEYLRKSPTFKFDPDAGPIVQGLSPSGTAFAIGSATYFQDWEFRSQLLRTAEIVGDTIKEKGKRHYHLGELAIVGEATVLAMRTNVSKLNN